MTLPATAPETHDFDTLAFVNELFGEARREKRRYLERWHKYYRALRNRTWCVDEQTEAFTKRGWVNGWDLSVLDEILSCTHDGQLVWSPVLHVYRNEHYDGPMLRIKNRYISALVTPEHRWLLDDGTLRPTDRLRRDDRIRYMGKPEDGVVESAYSDAFVEVIGWVVTEGHYAKNRQGNIEIVITQKAGESADRIRMVLKEAGWRGHEQPLEGRGYGLGRERTQGDLCRFYVVGELRDAILAVAPDKVTSDSFLLSLTSGQRHLLIDTMIAADGSHTTKGRRMFFQKNYDRIEAFVALCTLEGIATTVSRRRLSQYKSHHGGDLWLVYLKRGDTVTARWSKEPKRVPAKEEPYRGLVWCPTTAHGSFMARRDGRTFITGNSDQRPAWLPSPSSSEIFPAYHSLISWMTDQRPVMFCSPVPIPDPELNITHEEIMAKNSEMQEVLSSWYVLRGIGPQLESTLLDTFNFGCGILKTGWNQGYANGLGDASLHRVDPYDFLPDPNASNMDEARYVIEVKRVPLFEVCSRFPERGPQVQPDQGTDKPTDIRPRPQTGYEVVPMGNLAATGVTGTFPGTPTANIPPRYGFPGFAGPADYTKTVLLVECWVRTTETYSVPLIQDGSYMGDFDHERPVWQYVAVANNVVLTPDVSNPFAHGQCPYIRLPMMEMGEFWSIPLTEHMGPAQIALNRLLASLQTNAELLGNPVLLEDAGAGISRTKIINRAGGRLVKNQGSTVEWMKPPQIPQILERLVQFWRDSADRVSGISAVSRGSNLRRREAAATVDTVQEASFVRVRAVIRNMEEALRQAGNQVASNIAEFYYEPRSVPKIGPMGSQDYLNLGAHPFAVPHMQNGKLENVPLNFDVWIEAGSSLPLSRQTKTSEALSLYFAGAVDDEEVLKAFSWPEWQKVVKRVEEKKAKGLMAGPKNPRRK